MNEKNGTMEEMTAAEILEVLVHFKVLMVDGEKLGRPKESRTAYGYCDFDSQTIFVDTDHPQYTVIRTLMHELSHAYHYLRGLHDSEANTRRVEKNTWQTYKKARGLSKKWDKRKRTE